MRELLMEAVKAHAHGHIQKHKANVEVYLHNSAGIGEHSDIIEAIEAELQEMAKHQDVIDMATHYFIDQKL